MQKRKHPNKLLDAVSYQSKNAITAIGVVNLDAALTANGQIEKFFTEKFI